MWSSRDMGTSLSYTAGARADCAGLNALITHVPDHASSHKQQAEHQEPHRARASRIRKQRRIGNNGHAFLGVVGDRYLVSGLRGLNGLGGIAVLIGHGGFFHGVRVVTHDVLAVGILSIHECDRQSLNHLAPGVAPGRGIGGVQRHRPWILLRHGCAIRAEALNRLRRHRIATAIGIVRGDLQFDRLRPFEVAVLPYLLDGQVNGSATVLAARVLAVVRFGGESAVVVGHGRVEHEHGLGRHRASSWCCRPWSRPRRP